MPFQGCYHSCSLMPRLSEFNVSLGEDCDVTAVRYAMVPPRSFNRDYQRELSLQVHGHSGRPGAGGDVPGAGLSFPLLLQQRHQPGHLQLHEWYVTDALRRAPGGAYVTDAHCALTRSSAAAWAHTSIAHYSLTRSNVSDVLC